MPVKVKSKIGNGINLDNLQKTIDAMKDQPELAKSKFRVHNKWVSGGHNRSKINDFYGAGQAMFHKHTFKLEADEPAVLAGTDHGANPVEYLLSALASCMTTSMVYHAAVRGIKIDRLESELEGDIDLQGFTGLSTDVRKGFSNIRVTFRVRTDAENLERLKELTEFSPVRDTVCNGTSVDVRMERM